MKLASASVKGCSDVTLTLRRVKQEQYYDCDGSRPPGRQFRDGVATCTPAGIPDTMTVKCGRDEENGKYE